MHILIVQPTCDKKGHYGIWTVRMCQEIAKQGHKVTLYTNKVHPERYLQDKPRFQIVQVNGGKYSFEKYDNYRNRQLLFYRGYYKNSYIITDSALKWLRDKDVDVVFMTDIEFMVASLLLKRHRQHKVPVVMHVNAANFSFDTYVGSVFKKSYKVVQREIFKSVLGRQINALVVLGQWHERRLRKQLDLPDSFPIEVIPDAAEVSPKLFDKKEARRKLGIDFDGRVLLFFGILRRDKGIEHLFEALSLLKTDDFRLVIAGSVMEYTENEILKLVAERAISEKVITHLKYIPDDLVPFYFSACDAVILPYPELYSGGSGPLMKGACTYRRPVIATNVSELGRLTREYNLGLTAEPSDPRDLADKIREFISLPQQAELAMTQNAADLAKSNSWEALGDRYSRLYEKILRITSG